MKPVTLTSTLRICYRPFMLQFNEVNLREFAAGYPASFEGWGLVTRNIPLSFDYKKRIYFLLSYISVSGNSDVQ